MNPGRSLRMVRGAFPAAPERAPQPVRRERVIQALDAMAGEDRLVLALQLCEGFTSEEIGEILEMSPRAVLHTRDRLLIDIRRALEGLRPVARPRPVTVSLRSAL